MKSSTLLLQRERGIGVERERGQSKYGVMNRLWVGIVDLFGMMWLQRRARNTDITEVKPE